MQPPWQHSEEIYFLFVSFKNFLFMDGHHDHVDDHLSGEFGPVEGEVENFGFLGDL